MYGSLSPTRMCSFYDEYCPPIHPNKKYKYIIYIVSRNTEAAHPPLVSRGANQPHAEVGGRVEGAGLPGSQRLLCGARGERALAEVWPLGMHAYLYSSQSDAFNSLETFLSVDCTDSEQCLNLQHTMSIDSRNSAIFPSSGALLRINQVSVQPQSLRPHPDHFLNDFQFVVSV